MRYSTFISTLSLLSVVLAHPGSHEGHDIAKRTEFNNHARRSLADCQDSLKAHGIEARAIARREALANKLRKERAIEKRGNFLKARDLDTILVTSHESNKTGITSLSSPDQLFTGDVNCVLQPEATQGPYYVDGELIRADVRERQGGVNLFADIQLIDVNTCSPVPGAYLDWWHANATGVYSGIVASGNGDSSDLTNINATFLRGVQPTNDDGVAQFNTMFPGHYTSRTTHVHILAHMNASIANNNTITGGTVSHVGQLFFDQDLISTVEAVEPYSTNTQELTTNADDQILSEGAADMDPVMEYVLLGDRIEDGVMAWISIGIDATASVSVSSAASWTSHGGVANENSMGGGNGTAPGNMTAPPNM